MKKVEIQRYESQVSNGGFSDNTHTLYEFKVVIKNDDKEFVLRDWFANTDATALKRTSKVVQAYAENVLETLGAEWTLTHKKFKEHQEVVKTWKVEG